MSATTARWLSIAISVLSLIIPIAGVCVSLCYLRLSRRMGVVALGFGANLFVHLIQIGFQILFWSWPQMRGSFLYWIWSLWPLLSIATFALVIGGLAMVFSDLQRQLKATPPPLPSPTAPPYDMRPPSR